MWHYNNTNEIYHHGILGQKWGVRRYQNKDGSLTPAGKRKAAKMKEEYTALTGKRLIRKPTKKQSPSDVGNENADRKQIKGMSNTEIQNRIDRLQKEKQLAGLQSETASKGEKFVRAVGQQVLAPAAVEAGKRVLTNWFEKQGKELMGLNTKEAKTALQQLKEDAEISKLKRQIQQDKEWFTKRDTKEDKSNKSDKKQTKENNSNNSDKKENTDRNSYKEPIITRINKDEYDYYEIIDTPKSTKSKPVLVHPYKRKK